MSGRSRYPTSSYTRTNNILSPYQVDFGDIFPNFEHMYIGNNVGSGVGTTSFGNLNSNEAARRRGNGGR